MTTQEHMNRQLLTNGRKVLVVCVLLTDFTKTDCFSEFSEF